MSATRIAEVITVILNTLGISLVAVVLLLLIVGLLRGSRW